jgi:putative FmdB family regulatory protein
MPTYVYGCDACGHQFEQFQKFSDEPIRTCPRCSEHVRRIFQPAGIVFKGSGWHVTHYKRSGSNGSNGENKSGNGENKSGNGENKSGNGESKPTESKPTESKSESVASAASDAA